jgi:hypothetical protein
MARVTTILSRTTGERVCVGSVTSVILQNLNAASVDAVSHLLSGRF